MAHRSKIFEVIDAYSEESYAHDPISATRVGKREYDTEWNDYTYQAVDPFLKVAKSTFAKLSKLKPIDVHDERAKNVLMEELRRYIEDNDEKDLLFYHAYWGASFNPLDEVADIFSFMPHETPEEISNIIKRLDKVPQVCVEWISSLKDVAALGEVNAKCRVEWTIENVLNHSRTTFSRLREKVDPLKENKKLARAIKDAELAYEITGAWLSDVYLKMCKDEWRVGERRYVKYVEAQSGVTVNPREVYEYGLREIDRINKEMWVVARKIAPKAKSLTDVAAALNKNPKYVVNGRDELEKFLTGVTQSAIEELNDKYFVISPRIKRCDTKLDDDTIDESPYYWGPSDDLKRPGFAVYPTLKKDKFTIWENMSTWYHESVPGHHMQIATATMQKNKLSTYQRGEAWNSGYGEGWALYSEKLMDELGYFEDPGYKMGYLMNQAMRAARLVVDVGLHLGYKDPRGNVWTFRSAKKFMVERALLTDSYAESEIKRYICWAGQAISYKLGERVWLDAREDARTRLGNKFDLKKFHMYALKLGPMGLEMLKKELDNWNGKG